jgi:hypothetical protein
MHYAPQIEAILDNTPRLASPRKKQASTIVPFKIIALFSSRITTQHPLTMAAPSPASGNDLTPLSNLVSPARAHYLAATYILEVFSNAPSALSPTAATALRDKYSDIFAIDVKIVENDGNVHTGRDSAAKLVERLVGKGGPFEGWKFVVKGNVKLNGDFVWIAWGFGPADESEEGGVKVQVTGADGILLEKGEDGVVRIKKAHVIIDGASDVVGS